MRSATWATLVLAFSGCIVEPGLDESTTKCPASTPLATGFRLTVADPGRLVGRCVGVAHEGSDEPFALRKLGTDGVAHLPIEGQGRYVLDVSVRDADDKYCATTVVEFAEHPGTGVVSLEGQVGHVCA